MKRYLLMILVFLWALIPSVLLRAKSATVSERLIIETHFNMEILDDGKRRDAKMLVDLKIIEQDDGGFYVAWNEVFIDPVHEHKVMILKPFFHSTQEGSVKNVTIRKNAFSFVIDLSGQFFGKGRTLQVVGTRKKESLISEKYDVKGSGLWWSDILNRPTRTELRSTDKRIVLPYREVY